MNTVFKTSQLVAQAKKACKIDKPNALMSDDDIRAVAHWVGMHAPDTSCANGEVKFRKIGIGLMLFITMMEFPDFYVRYELSQFN